MGRYPEVNEKKKEQSMSDAQVEGQIGQETKKTKGGQRGGKRRSPEPIKIDDLPANLVLKWLFDNAIKGGLDPEKEVDTLELDEIDFLLSDTKEFHYLYGRVMGGLDFSKEFFNPITYDRNNYMRDKKNVLTARQVIDNFRDRLTSEKQ